MQTVADAGTIDGVVVYESGALVTRVIRHELAQGLWTVRIGGLPVNTAGESVHASVASADGTRAGAVPKLLGVEYVQTPLAEFAGTPEGVAAANKLREMIRQLDYLKQDDAQADLQLKLVEQIGVRTTANATNDGGTQALNLDAVHRQLEFVASERARLVEAKRALRVRFEELQHQIEAAQKDLAARGGADRVERAALVMIGVPEDATIHVELSYMVPDAGWEPAYNIRGAGDRTGVQVEYDAVVKQSSGEDWKDVRMSLSTAEPQRASMPPEVEPWFVDVYVPTPDLKSMSGGGGGFGGGVAEDRESAKDSGTHGAIFGAPGGAPARADSDAGRITARRKAEIEGLAASAGVQEAGPSVSYDLPRRLTVPSDENKSQRTRIATVDPKTTFAYTAQPIVTEDVFLRGDLVNSSAFQLLPGRAQIFMGGDFIGETAMPPVAPKDEFSVYFGPDRALKAKRQLVSKTTGAAGIFGGSETTTWNYRVTVENGTGRDASVELYDRRLVSRNEAIEVAVLNLSQPLSTDSEYVERLQPSGILRWDLTVPATARGDAAMPIGWTVQLTRSKKVQTTPLPPD